MLKSTQDRFLDVLQAPKIDAITIQGCSRATLVRPRSLEGRSVASPERLGSVPRAPQGCPESGQRRPGTPKRPSKSVGKRTEAIQSDATSVLGVKKWSFFARVTGKRAQSDILSIVGRFCESGELRFVPRLSAKTRVQLSVLCMDVQRRKNSDIDAKIGPKL